ncbi:MAG TPA: riboflavin synthase [Phycisphaerae bacterium]|nr:riboflavin synthase [Phycisphaerales bacterium]HRX85864.1 riboflavin synthase [Phycisphaerae bacterium]
MFTGIIETTGRIVRTAPVAGGRKLCVDAGVVAGDAVHGASIAVNGVCLTVTGVAAGEVNFDVITETLERTNLGRLRPGDRVNLERSLTPTSRLDGHFVQGHVDGVGEVTRRIDTPREWVLWIRGDDTVRPYVVPKGSVAIDGISLTIAAVEGDQFSVAIIPTTLERTNLADRKVGDRVNLESDIVARTVVHHLRHMQSAGGLTLDSLREHGYL